MAAWNPNSPVTVGFEPRFVGANTKRIAAAGEQQVIRWRAAATGAVTDLSFAGGPGTSAPSVPDGPLRAKYESSYAGVRAVPDTVRPVLLAETVARADEAPLGAVTTTTYPVTAISTIGLNGFIGATGLAGTSADVFDLDDDYLTDAAGGGAARGGFTFGAASAFPAGRHILAVEFVIVASGTIYAAVEKAHPSTASQWHREIDAAKWTEPESVEHLYQLGEVRPGIVGFVGATPTDGMMRWTQADIVAFSTTGLSGRRLFLQDDHLEGGAVSVIDYVAMRVHHIAERRLAVGMFAPTDTDGTWENVPVATPTGGTWSRTSGVDYSTIVRRSAPGNVVGYQAAASIRLRRMAGAVLANHETVSASSVDAYHQPLTFGAAEDATVAWRVRNGVSDQAESVPYPWAGYRDVDSFLTVNIVAPAAAIYDVAYAILACDEGATTLTATLFAGVGSGASTVVTVTRADWAMSPLIGTMEVVDADGAARTLTFRRVRLDFGAGVILGLSSGSVRLNGTGPGWYSAGYINGGEPQSWHGATAEAGYNYADRPADSSGGGDTLLVVSQKPPAPTSVVGAVRRWTTALAGNLLVNAGFEDGLAGWALTGTVTYDSSTDIYIDTGRGAALLGAGGAVGQPAHSTPEQPGTRFRVSGGEVLELGARLTAVGAPTTATFRFRFRATDAVAATPQDHSFTFTGLGTAAFVSRVARVTVPAGYRFLDVDISAPSFAVDRVSLTRVPTDAAPPAAVVGSGAHMVTPGDIGTWEYAVLSWAAGFTTDLVRYEVERFDAARGWEQVAVHTDLAALSFSDHEARFGVVNAYRVRAVRADETGSDAVEPAADLRLTGPRCALVFTSNVAPELNVGYEDVSSQAPPRDYTFGEAQDVVTRAFYGRDHEAVFRPTERRGVTFRRALLAPGWKMPTVRGPSPFDPLRDLAAATGPYVCVRDGQGQRWLASLIVPDAVMEEQAGSNVANVTIVEVAGAPTAVET